MSYGQFLLTFLGAPIAVLAILCRRFLGRSTVVLLLILAVAALIYTGPWDNLLVAEHVWSFNQGKVLGLLIGRVPIEEYIFYILQVAVTALWIIWLAQRIRPE